MMPRALRDVIARAIAIAPDMREVIERHYLDLMPRMRDEQLAHPLMRAPLVWDRLPRMRAAIERVARHLPAARGALDATSLAELHAATYYGGCMPMLYAYPADLAYFLSRDLGIDATIDRYLTAPVVHELCHGDRDRDALCPHLDECAGGWLGVHVWPEFAYPVAGQDDAIYASPWLAQVGAALVRVFGIDAVVHHTLPRDFIDASERAYWADWTVRRSLHFLSDTLNPQPWLELIFADRELRPDRDADVAIVADALRAMCLETTQVGGSFRTRTVTPVTVRVEPGYVTTAAKNAFDVVTPWHWAPVTRSCEVVMERSEDIPALAATLVP